MAKERINKERHVQGVYHTGGSRTGQVHCIVWFKGKKRIKAFSYHVRPGGRSREEAERLAQEFAEKFKNGEIDLIKGRSKR